MSEQRKRVFSDAERERITKLCRVLTTERRVWHARFSAWLSEAVERRDPEGLDRFIEHDPRAEPLRTELMGYLRRMLPDREVGPKELTMMLDLFAETHGYDWKGEKVSADRSTVNGEER